MMDKKISKIIIIIVGIIVLIGGYLILKKVFKDTAKLELNGLSELVIYENDSFNDPGYQIIENKKDIEGYYVNQDSNINLARPGNYYIKYMLYSKNGDLLYEVTRQVIVLEDVISHIELKLNGEEEEYFFVDDYSNHGAIALKDGNDISNQIEVIDNVVSNLPGSYDVKYRITMDNKTKEINRKVNVINLNIEEKIDKEKLIINLSYDINDFDYVILPDGTKSNENKISYPYKDIGNYDFDIYLKSGSHKKYTVNIVSIDKEGPTGTCIVYYENNKTNINMNAFDTSGIKKYSYNGIDFYNNTNLIEGVITNITIRAYDNMDNYSDIKCQAKYQPGIKTINKDKSGYSKCGTDYTNDNNELDALMQSYGYKTRDAVVAAALYLANYKIKIQYSWGGKYLYKGLNPKWGCSSHTEKHNDRLVCTKELGSDSCELGLDCTGYTSWAFIQAGFDKSVLRTSSQSTGMWGEFNAKTHKYSFRNDQDKVNLIKPGDIVWREGHVGMVIGVNDTTLQIANMLGPIIVQENSKLTGKNTSGGQREFTHFVLFDDFFKLYGN